MFKPQRASSRHLLDTRSDTCLTLQRTFAKVLPYTFVAEDGASTYQISDLTTVYSESISKSKAKSYMVEMENMAKNLLDYTEVLKMTMAQIGQSTSQISPDPQIKLSPKIPKWATSSPACFKANGNSTSTTWCKGVHYPFDSWGCEPSITSRAMILQCPTSLLSVFDPSQVEL